MHLEFLIPSLAAITTSLFWFSYKKSDYLLLSFNAIILGTVILLAPAINNFSSLVLLAVFFVAQLNMAILTVFKEKKTYVSEQTAHIIVLHLVAVILFTFSSYVLTQIKNLKSSITEA